MSNCPCHTPQETQDAIIEATEQIVILYANHSGRESDNRALFRADVERVITKTIRDAKRKEREAIVKEIEAMKTDERKVARFNEYEAVTYQDKMLVNEVLSVVISRIKSKEDTI